MHVRSQASRSLLALGSLLALVAGGVAGAVPMRGQSLASIVVLDTEGRPHTLPERDTPTLVFYEDRQAGTQNHALHRLLSDIVDRPENQGKLAVVPIGDVEAYDFWPARGIATRVIRGRSLEDHTNILCDWKGTLRKTWGFTRHKSTNILFGADGRVLFAGEGPLSDAQVQELLDRLSELGVNARR
jgi:hypothetical protein